MEVEDDRTAGNSARPWDTYELAIWDTEADTVPGSCDLEALGLELHWGLSGSRSTGWGQLAATFEVPRPTAPVAAITAVHVGTSLARFTLRADAATARR